MEAAMLRGQLRALALVAVVALCAPLTAQKSQLGYYRQPAIWNDTIVFVAEGDLWRVNVAGGVAQRLTTHPEEESRPAISPDGRTLAYAATYEGPGEVYTLPLGGGTPARHTWDATRPSWLSWTPKGEVLYATRKHSTLPNAQLVRLDPATHARTIVPLAQASDGAFDAAGATLFFTRLSFQGSHTRRYKGGTAQNLWRFAGAGTEATALTGDYSGTSKTPMPWNGRIYFATDRDGVMNLWSMDERGGNLKQHTKHSDYDVQSPSLSNGRIAYQQGADIRVFDIASGTDKALPITLVSDFDQLRERWVKNAIDWISSAHISPSGDRVAITARGQVFVAPALQGRMVEATRNKLTRHRNARFMSDGKTILTLSDESDEVEFWQVPANGVGAGTQLSRDGTVLRWDGLPSPDGNYIAHHDKNQQLWIFDVAKKVQKKVAESAEGEFDDLQWSPDSKWLAYAAPGPNLLTRIFLYEFGTGRIVPVTSDRYDSSSPTWSPDGKWLYFLSDRNFESLVGGPWGSRQPEPYWDRQTKIYHVALTRGERSPFQQDDELQPAKPAEKPAPEKPASDTPATNKPVTDKPAPEKPAIEKPAIDKPATDKPAAASAGATPAAGAAKPDAKPAAADKPVVPTVVVDADGLEARLLDVPLAAGNYSNLSMDAKRLYFISRPTGRDGKAALKTLALDNKKAEPETFIEEPQSYELSLDGKKILIRKARDFYVVDAGAKAPTDLSKLAVPLKDWTFSLDPRLEWRQMFTEAWRLERDYFYDRRGPLAQPGVDVAEDDVIESVNGVAALTVPDISVLLRGQAGKQVLLRVKPKAGGPGRDVIAVPVSAQAEDGLRYDEWEYTRRLAVEKASRNQIGYVHLRAMGGGNMAEWMREFYPAFDRPGLIIDVRHNNGGNIDSWILGRLLRKAWFYWQPRVGHPTWNMQFAFRGHMVVLVNQQTASDGEAFAEGFRRLGLGKVMGMRTWGGEVWLSQNNFLVDRGIATAAEMGVYGPEGQWLIEGHGVDPDILVDNLPAETFGGKDAQLDAAIRHLQDLIKTKPIPVPPPPPYPIKR
jgi:tricorn protease